MARTLWTFWAVAMLTLAGGCATLPELEGPAFMAPGETAIENPMYVPQGLKFESYHKVFDATLSTLNDFGFTILESNMFDGHIETTPRVAPGLCLFLKPGNPDLYDRLLATFQTYRHRCLVVIQPAKNSGYFISLTVFKELEDLPRPVRSTAGAAAFRSENNVERQFEVIDPTLFEAMWIPKGRDHDVEQMLLERLERKLR